MLRQPATARHCEGGLTSVDEGEAVAAAHGGVRHGDGIAVASSCTAGGGTRLLLWSGLGTCPLAGTSLFKQPQPRVLTRLPNFCGRQQSDKHGSPGAAAVPWAASKAAKQSASMAVPGAAGRRQGGGLAIAARPAGRYGRPDNAQNALKAGTCGQIRRNRLLTIHPIKPLPQEFVHACQPPCSLNELQKPKAVAGLATLASVLCK